MADLSQVVSLLSTESVMLLNEQNPGIQQFVVETITCCVNVWEQRGVLLDPITREAVLDSLVAIHIATAQGFTQLIMDARNDPSGAG